MTSDQRKVCVVSLIGKSQFQSDRNKAWKLNSLIQKNLFKTDSKLREKFLKKIEASKNEASEGDTNPKDNEEGNSSKLKSTDHGIQTYHDQKNRVIYVHLESIFDTNNIFELLIKKYPTANEDQKNFFEQWESEQLKYLKSVLLIFSISHIVIISNPSCEIDITYVRFFRLIDSLRNKLMPSLVELLKSLDLPIEKDWIYSGRPCSPRVLFTFENCPRDLLHDQNSNQILEKFQHALEDQIYNSLRKSYVITNISNNSIFAIPANQEFVYVHRTSHETTNINKLLMSNPDFTSSSVFDNSSFNKFNRSTFGSTGGSLANLSISGATSFDSNSVDTDAKLFREFVFKHINIALEDGFNDNFGRTNSIQPVFELPTAETWHKIYESLRDFFLTDTPKSSKLAAYYSQLKSQIDLDVQFSENRCKKLLHPALSLYQESLPAHYNKHQHQQRLEKALSLYQINARGPMYNHYLAQLKRECSNVWLNGRQLCEAVSLTGHNCVLELHRLPTISVNETTTIFPTTDDEPICVTETESATTIATTTNSEKSEDETTLTSSHRRFMKVESIKRSRGHRTVSSTANRSELKTKLHTSNIVTLAASNCGEFQRERKDPFELKEANYAFYEDFSNLPDVAAHQLRFVKYSFPIFKPSVPNAKPSSNTIHEKQQSLSIQASSSIGSQSTQQQQQELSANVNLSQDNTNNTANRSPINLDNSISQSASHQTSDKPVQTQNVSSTSKPETEDQIKDETISISTEIYLTGMTHSDSPVGLLPRFSSWSLISIGKFADYNDHTGLTQPGFMPNHNFLIPWELVVSNNTVTSLHDKPSLRKNQNQKALVGDFDNNLNRQRKRVDSVTVRSYIGVEYECPCGHRFICSGPDRIVKLSNNGIIKGDAYKLLNMDMPLYTACPCRNSKDSTPYMAQLMRVFIVTPPGNIQSEDSSSTSSFLRLSIRPRVQPNPAPCPLFWPSQHDPIMLADDSIWVLRLPYIYMGDDEKPYSRPTDFETLNNCKVLKGMFSASLISSN